MQNQSVELIQFEFSHYNEKIRWALDFKGIPHKRTSLLPGPHAGTMKKMTGQTQVPAVRFGDQIVNGSAAIIQTLETRYPDPPLYPPESQAQARKDALSLQQQFDDDVGPTIRRALFSILIHEPDYLTRMFARHRSWLAQKLYRGMFPIAKSRMSQSMELDKPGAVEAAFKATEKALDLVADRSQATGYLAGNSFSVADLTAAALLAPAANPSHPDMKRPEPMPASLRNWTARWSDHPGTVWIHNQYAKHRPPPAARA